MMPDLDAEHLFATLGDDPDEIVLEPVAIDLILDFAIEVYSRAPDYQPHCGHDTTSARIDHLRPRDRSIGMERLNWMMAPLLARIVERDDEARSKLGFECEAFPPQSADDLPAAAVGGPPSH
jgi:hypothetical protein